MNAAVEKARRTWRVTKASQEARIASLENWLEEANTRARDWMDRAIPAIEEAAMLNVRADHWKQRANLWRRLALASCSAFLVLAAWGWPW